MVCPVCRNNVLSAARSLISIGAEGDELGAGDTVRAGVVAGVAAQPPAKATTGRHKAASTRALILGCLVAMFASTVCLQDVSTCLAGCRAVSDHGRGPRPDTAFCAGENVCQLVVSAVSSSTNEVCSELSSLPLKDTVTVWPARLDTS